MMYQHVQDLMRELRNMNHRYASPVMFKATNDTLPAKLTHILPLIVIIRWLSYFGVCPNVSFKPTVGQARLVKHLAAFPLT